MTQSESIFGKVDRAAVPIAATGDRSVLLTAAGVPFSGAAGTTVLPASGAWTQSEVRSVLPARRLVVEVAYNAHASTTAGYPQIIVMLSSVAASGVDGSPFPAIGDDVWFIPGVTDGVVTSAALTAGAIGAGSDYTVTAEWGAVDYHEMVVNCKKALANSDKIRMRFSVDVTDAKFFALQAREIGDTTNRGILNLAIVGGS